MKFEAFIAGIAAYGRAFSFIGKHRLHRFYIIPGIFGFLFFLAAALVILHWIPMLAEYIFSFLVNNYNGVPSALVNKMYKVLDVLK